MRKVNQICSLFVIALALVAVGCGSDGKDGQPGADGTNATDGNSTVTSVTKSQETNVSLLSYKPEAGKISVEFEVTDEAGLKIDGLKAASLYFAALTEDGIQRSRAGDVGGAAFVGGAGGSRNPDTEGASLSVTDTGRYLFVAPMPAVEASSEGIFRLQVGLEEGDIAESREIIIHKPDALHTTTSTESCYSCHVDYANSDIRHSSHVAIDTEGNVDFVTGCMVCHNNVAQERDENGVYSGGYARNTMQSLGHINHQKFETGFDVSNCYSCHAKPISTVLSLQTCNACHDALQTTVQSSLAKLPTKQQTQIFYAQAASDTDYRSFHRAAAKRSEIRATYSSSVSEPYWDKDIIWVEGEAATGGICFDINLYKKDGNTVSALNISELLVGEDETATAERYVTYAAGYIHGYDSENKTIVGRAIGRGTEQHIARPDGTYSECFPNLVNGFAGVDLNASSRVTIAMVGQDESEASVDGVTLHDYSDAVSTDYYSIDLSTTAPTFTASTEYQRRHSVTKESCSTCHNKVTSLHRNGAFADGGLGCVACHNNGQDRRAGFSGPGFGPMIHSMHWGAGSVEIVDGEEVGNSATSLNAANCVSCHGEVVDLAAVPNQYIRARAINQGDTTKMASPITANCYACHNGQPAVAHMLQNGGEISADKGAGDDGVWFTQKTNESCATCHNKEREFGIEKYHVFSR